ncbi:MULTISPECIES: hypothetical protein [unclassified Nonomuraea]|uniref:hypothetical protein n=1 Tax=unclassified Nonomuraea TaxID=2593643 RepID=UPI0033C8F1FF
MDNQPPPPAAPDPASAPRPADSAGPHSDPAATPGDSARPPGEPAAAADSAGPPGEPAGTAAAAGDPTNDPAAGPLAGPAAAPAKSPRTGRRARRVWKVVVVALAGLLFAVVGGVALAYPSLAATTCPGCYGLTELSPGVHVEDGLTPAQREHVGEVADQAARRVTTFYGGRLSSPGLLVCLTEACYRRIGGGQERGVAVLNRSVMLSPRGLDPVIASHEMSHVELHARLASSADVPQWFDEGLAVVVSGDPRHLAPESAPDRCLVAPSGPLPVTLEEWLRTASADPATYARSACQVSRWLGENGGRAGLLGLVTRLNAGEPFSALVRTH